MLRRRSKKLILLFFGDCFLLYLSLYATLFLRYSGTKDGDVIIARHFTPFTLVFVLWLLMFGAFGLFELRLMKNERHFLYRLLQAMALNIVFAVMIFYLIPVWAIEPRRNLFLIASLATALIFSWRYLFNQTIIRTGAAKVLFVGMPKEAVALAEYLKENPQFGHRPVGFVTDQDLDAALRSAKPDTIVISQHMKQDAQIIRTLFRIVPQGIAVVEFSAFHEMLTGKIPLSLIGELWFLENLIGTKKRFYEFFKRIIDSVLALILAAIGLPFFPFICLAMILSTPNEVFNYKQRRARPGDGIIFFRQKRVGRNGKEFDFIKLRSQRLGAEKISAQIHEAKEIENDPRQYWVGKLLRKTYLDELPQLWNVLKGEMSFVGPRPERPQYVERFKEKVPFYEMRLLVPPGITGWAQINMENDASVEDAPEKMQYDLYYIKNRSLTLDLLIALRTLSALVRRQGR